MRVLWVAFALTFSILLCLQPAHAQKRVALVIGNSAYQHTTKLTNPKNDASDIAAALKKHGFEVVEGFDLDKAAFDRKVREFSAALKGAEAGLFFYAGHGLQVAGHNYLVPIDAKAETEDALDWEMLKVDVVHRAMERSTNTNILFLDACRDNPLARNLARAMGTRSSYVGRGLATIESGVGTLISFSTQPGNVALDGTGRNSPFAGSLVNHIANSTDSLSDLLIGVRNDVRKETQNKQVPWEHSALTGRFYFKPPMQTATVPKVEPARLSEAAEAWDRVKDATSVNLLEAFSTRYRDTFYVEMARARIEELKKSQVAVATTGPSNAVGARRIIVFVRSQELMDVRGLPKLLDVAFADFVSTAQKWYKLGAALSPVDVLSVAQDGTVHRVFTGEEAALQQAEASAARLHGTAPKTPDMLRLRQQLETKDAEGLVIIMDGSSIDHPKQVSELKLLASDLIARKGGRGLQFFLSSDSCSIWKSHLPELKCTEFRGLRQVEREVMLKEALIGFLNPVSETK